jgi:hypothetical protein
MISIMDNAFGYKYLIDRLDYLYDAGVGEVQKYFEYLYIR